MNGNIFLGERVRDIRSGMGITSVRIESVVRRIIPRILQGEDQEAIRFQGLGGGLLDRLQVAEIAEGVG